MQNHEPEVVQYFSTLAYILKEADDDGVEVMMATDKQTIKSKKSTELKDYVTKRFHHGAGSHCFMEQCLAKLLRDIIARLPDNKNLSLRESLHIPLRRKKKPISIYVLTDGAWAPFYKEVLKNLTDPIRSLVIEIKRRTLERSYVVLQFVRFGKGSSDAIELLDHLDDFLPHEE